MSLTCSSSDFMRAVKYKLQPCGNYPGVRFLPLGSLKGLVLVDLDNSLYYILTWSINYFFPNTVSLQQSISFRTEKRDGSLQKKTLTACKFFFAFDAVYWARVSFLWWPWCSKSRSFVVCLISRGQPTIYPHPPLCPALPIKDVSSEVYLPAKVDMWSHVVTCGQGTHVLWSSEAKLGNFIHFGPVVKTNILLPLQSSAK